jgi:hypothetical protein
MEIVLMTVGFWTVLWLLCKKLPEAWNEANERRINMQIAMMNARAEAQSRELQQTDLPAEQKVGGA